MSRIAITGSGGRIGRSLRARLGAAGAGHELVLVDVVDQERASLGPGRDGPDGPRERVVRADIADIDAMTDAFAGADLVVHLAGFPEEREWDDILRVNIDGTHAVCEAARRAGVPRLLLASSVHAVGYVPVTDARDEVVHPRPDTFYGVSKAAVEALGSVYADRFGLLVIAARIMTFEPRPSTARSLSTWLSEDDMARMVVAALTTSATGSHVIWGVSRNTRRYVSLVAGSTIGFEPQDDAELFVADIADPSATPPALGGTFVDVEHPLGENWV